MQQAGQEALAGGTGKGAFAVMDVHNGEVLGLGSQPSFDPNLFAKGVRKSDYKRLTDENGARSPTARSRAAIRPARPSSSITATAALESGLITSGHTCSTTPARSPSAA